MNKAFVISDGTGRTAQQTLEAALTQFPETKVVIRVCPEVRTRDQVREIMEEVSEAKGFVVHTVVSKSLRDYVLEAGRLNNVETIDLMGPLLAQLSHQLAGSPSERPGLFHELNKAYFQRIDAMEFALRHDDGQRPHELSKAEIVLVGVSRTFKTPLSIYLAFRGWFVANVPIVLGIEPISELFDLPPERVFALTTEPNRLVSLRRVRHNRLRRATGEYADPDFVRRELRYAQGLFSTQPDWPVINVTNKPIEEIASQILAILRKRRKARRQSENRR
jgi:regulator of PEP synthase PpsR (kinase-PPPase family)